MSEFRYVRGRPGDGLTCATFVMAIFREFGIELLDTSNWPVRGTDLLWLSKTISFLETWGEKERAEGRGDPDLPDHISALRNSATALRFRPQEVAGAAWSEMHPIDFQTAEILGTGIIGQVPSYVSKHAAPCP